MRGRDDDPRTVAPPATIALWLEVIRTMDADGLDAFARWLGGTWVVTPPLERAIAARERELRGASGAK